MSEAEWSESRERWRIFAVFLVAVFIGLMIGLASPDAKYHCRWACEPEAKGFSWEAGKCECIR